MAKVSGEVANPTGAANTGEVEDYQVTITTSLDYGDAPDTGAGTGVGNYNTVATDSGPSHVIVANLQLGATAPDADNGTLQNVAATADDTTGTPDDEDSIDDAADDPDDVDQRADARGGDQQHDDSGDAGLLDRLQPGRRLPGHGRAVDERDRAGQLRDGELQRELQRFRGARGGR